MRFEGSCGEKDGSDFFRNKFRKLHPVDPIHLASGGGLGGKARCDAKEKEEEE
jgi:hypothetical protein